MHRFDKVRELRGLRGNEVPQGRRGFIGALARKVFLRKDFNKPFTVCTCLFGGENCFANRFAKVTRELFYKIVVSRTVLQNPLRKPF